MVLKDSVIENWATALTNIAVDGKKIDMFIEQSSALIDVLKDQDDFVKILTIKNENLEAKRIAIIDDTFGSFEFDIDIINAMKILVEMQAFASARVIFKHLRKRLVALHDITFGVIWSTEKIDEKTISKIEEKITKQINMNVKLVNKIDEKLIGGLQVIVNNQIFDGTIKGKLDAMRYEVLKKK